MMRRPPQSSVTPSSLPRTLVAPVGGWNARDPLANMPATDAVFLDNWFPRAGDVVQRRGREEFADIPADNYGVDPHNIRTLMSYSSPAGSLKLFACAEDGIYDVTAGGQQLSVGSAATHNAWEWTNITTSGGSFLWCCNGVDKSRVYNGATWTELDGFSSPALTGITSTDIVNVSLFKSRLVFCEKDSLSFWYLPVNSIAGAAVEFPLGAVFRRGGYLMATSAWTLDGGNGPEDYFAAITSEGELAIYAGTDPSSTSAWGLVGVYLIGRPLSRRCFVTIGGELCALTVRGLFPLSRTLQLARQDFRKAVSDKIAPAWTFYTDNFGSLFGWQSVVFSEGPFLLVNVPILRDPAYPEGTISYQFVMNLETRAWCRFLGWPAECWVVHGGRLFCGLRNKVFEAWKGSDDVGFAIDSRGKQAFIRPAGGRRVHGSLVKPILQGTGEAEFFAGIDVDYAEGSGATGSAFSFASAVALWGQALWNQARWSSNSSVDSSWRTAFHYPSEAIAVRLRAVGKSGNISWIATGLNLKVGGVL